MSGLVYNQNIIAVIWDFDNTLIPGSMQEVIFRHFGIDTRSFWEEVDNLPRYYQENFGVRMSNEFAYLNRFIEYVEEGIFPGLTNQRLREFGRDLEFYPGLPDFFDRIRRHIEEDEEFRTYDISLEHYIVSTGFYETILGSAIAPSVEDVWACQFLEDPAPARFDFCSLPPARGGISRIAYQVDQTTKTRAIYEINKGCNKNQEIDVNSLVPPENRRVPFTNMIYIADGPSDIPVFSLLRKYGGRVYAVYNEKSLSQFEQVDRLQNEGRISSYGPSDYREGSQTTLWLLTHTRQIARSIIARLDQQSRMTFQRPPEHIKE